MCSLAFSGSSIILPCSSIVSYSSFVYFPHILALCFQNVLDFVPPSDFILFSSSSVNILSDSSILFLRSVWAFLRVSRFVLIVLLSLVFMAWLYCLLSCLTVSLAAL